MTGINEIKAMALAYGACDKVSGISSISEAIHMLMTPQGREFALKTGFPTLEVWRNNTNQAKEIQEIYLDIKNVLVINHDCVCIGDSVISVEIDNPDKLYHVIAMHGAKVEVHASNYAVVTVTNVNAETIIHHDGTAIVRVEQTEKGG